MNLRVLLITSNRHDLTTSAKDELIKTQFSDMENVNIVSDPLLVFPKYLKRNLKSNDKVVVVYDDGTYKVFREAERLKKFLRGKTTATWKLLQSYKE